MAMIFYLGTNHLHGPQSESCGGSGWGHSEGMACLYALALGDADRTGLISEANLSHSEAKRLHCDTLTSLEEGWSQVKQQILCVEH